MKKINTKTEGSANKAAAKRLSTRQLLTKIPNFQNLYRHSLNGTYYAVKKHNGKRREKSLETDDRKIAERRLREWLENLNKVDAEVEKTTLAQLLQKFKAVRTNKEPKTIQTEASIIKNFSENFGCGMDTEVSKVRASMLDEWMSKQDIKKSTYERFKLFLKQLFDIARNDNIVAESPYYRMAKVKVRDDKSERWIPSDEQFDAIVASIRNEKQNFYAQESADLIEFMGRAALGQAEAAFLEWGKVNFDESKMLVRRQKTGKLFEVPLYPKVKALLEKMHARFETPPPSDAKVFSIKDARKALTNACKRLGYRHFSQRNIRAYGIGTLWKKGIDVKLIAQWQGHSDGGVLILKTYTQVFGAQDRAYESTQLAKLVD